MPSYVLDFGYAYGNCIELDDLIGSSWRSEGEVLWYLRSRHDLMVEITNALHRFPSPPFRMIYVDHSTFVFPILLSVNTSVGQLHSVLTRILYEV